MGIRAAGLGLVLLLVLTSCASGAGRAGGDPQAGRTASPSASPPARTAVRTFTPFDPSGTVAVPVAARTQGSCFAASIAAPGVGAYRCFAGNTILDPCFAAPGPGGRGRLACVTDPWSPATVLRLTQPLPGRGAPGTDERAWAVVLAGDVRCVASTGTVPSVAGVALDYACSDGGAAAVSPMGPGAVNDTALYAAKGASTVQHRLVTVVWHA